MQHGVRGRRRPSHIPCAPITVRLRLLRHISRQMLPMLHAMLMANATPCMRACPACQVIPNVVCHLASPMTAPCALPTTVPVQSLACPARSSSGWVSALPTAPGRTHCAPGPPDLSATNTRHRHGTPVTASLRKPTSRHLTHKLFQLASVHGAEAQHVCQHVSGCAAVHQGAQGGRPVVWCCCCWWWWGACCWRRRSSRAAGSQGRPQGPACSEAERQQITTSLHVLWFFCWC